MKGDGEIVEEIVTKDRHKEINKVGFVHTFIAVTYISDICYDTTYTYCLLQGGYVIVVVCLLATLCKNFQTDLHEIFMEGWQWANEQMIKFWWRSGSLSGYRDCFPDSSLLGDMESG